MSGIVALILFVGLIIYLLGYIFFRSLLWIFEPLIGYFNQQNSGENLVEEEETEEDTV